MARTLPWLKNAPTTTSHSSNPRPNKRQRTHEPPSDTETRPQIATEKQKPTALRSARTPSTSPPPQPPPPSPLRPGLHADDIYIMVEDEFLATARAFTAHLHHAEYLRLKNAAKARSGNAVNGIGGIERPVDGITAMRAETRKQKEAEAKEKKVRGAVDGIIAPAGEGRRRPSDGDGEGSDISDFEDEGERHDDPWQGTQLQRFMTKSPKKGSKGLTGLQGVVSHTRAAAGFQKPEKKRDGRGGSPTPTSGRGVGGMKGRGGEEEEEEEDDDEDTDDLDAPTYTRPRQPTRPPPSSSLTKPKPLQPAATTITTILTIGVSQPPKPPPKPKPNPPRAFLDVTPLPLPLHKHPPNAKLPLYSQPLIKQEQDPVVKFERGDKGEGGDVLWGIRQRSEARRRRREREKRGKEGDGGRGDEIPVFLV
ncbi:hypothetical protein JMJ35_005135 [Cladonia borealis]|uniref:Uncharacterized protein n=1 Tax=Cladonia borealis TaxID=184061 RepID=A0AA39V1F0_9LECA|nr:hypothetical protein JMJ35_005135 [Cladonia borealis]